MGYIKYRLGNLGEQIVDIEYPSMVYIDTDVTPINKMTESDLASYIKSLQDYRNDLYNRSQQSATWRETYGTANAAATEAMIALLRAQTGYVAPEPEKKIPQELEIEEPDIDEIKITTLTTQANKTKTILIVGGIVVAFGLLAFIMIIKK